MKQETLEEVAEKLTNDFPVSEVRFNMTKEEVNGWFLEALQSGAKWQQERMYNKEKVDKLLDALIQNNMCSVAGDELIEQFKNK